MPRPRNTEVRSKLAGQVPTVANLCSDIDASCSPGRLPRISCPLLTLVLDGGVSGIAMYAEDIFALVIQLAVLFDVILYIYETMHYILQYIHGTPIVSSCATKFFK